MSRFRVPVQWSPARIAMRTLLLAVAVAAPRGLPPGGAVQASSPEGVDWGVQEPLLGGVKCVLQRNARFFYLYEPLRAQFRAPFGLAMSRHGESSAAYFQRRDRIFLYKDKAGLARGGLCNLPPTEIESVCRCKHIAIKTIRINGELNHLLLALGAINRTDFDLTRGGGWNGPTDMSGDEVELRMNGKGKGRRLRSGGRTDEHMSAISNWADEEDLKFGGRSRGGDEEAVGGIRDGGGGRDGGSSGGRRLGAGSGGSVGEVLSPPALARQIHILHLVRVRGGVELRYPRITAFEIAGALCRKTDADRCAGLAAEGRRLAGKTGNSDRKDLAREPEGTARRLYAQLGIQLPPPLLKWINASTHIATLKAGAAVAKFQRFTRANAIGGLDVAHDPHATVRNAARIVNKWRSN
ncbi:hypothetical protein T492DRAFT_961290, partial [Pavlovales sp. CCMP2436]